MKKGLRTFYDMTLLDCNPLVCLADQVHKKTQQLSKSIVGILNLMNDGSDLNQRWLDDSNDPIPRISVGSCPWPHVAGF